MYSYTRVANYIIDHSTRLMIFSEKLLPFNAAVHIIYRVYSIYIPEKEIKGNAASNCKRPASLFERERIALYIGIYTIQPSDL